VRKGETCVIEEFNKVQYYGSVWRILELRSRPFMLVVSRCTRDSLLWSSPKS